VPLVWTVQEKAGGGPAGGSEGLDTRAITAAADPWLDALTSARLQEAVVRDGRPTAYIYGNLLQRVIYHYWYHTGENMAIRQLLGHASLPEFVGDIDGEAPYRPDPGPEM